MKRILVGTLMCGLWLQPAWAHHSFAAEYDAAKPMVVKGKVTDIDWSNPHAYIHLEVTDATGKVSAMLVEGHPPNILRRTGWVKDVIQVNDEVQISGWAARDGNATRMAGREVTLRDGKKLFWGPPSQ
jgi:hypothetical protein